MAPAPNPFLDPDLVRGKLYDDPRRMTRRTSALHRAKITGDHAAHVAAELAADHLLAGHQPTVLDIGCGRGTSTRALAARLRPALLIALDASTALVREARSLATANLARVAYVTGDFHRLPLLDCCCHLVLAAFCLYHSPQPAVVIREIARCLAPEGIAVLVTKSLDSYRELDVLVAASGLDEQAANRPSLYAAVHSDNLPDLTAAALDVRQVVHHEHRFRFADLGHAAEYLATSPKYHLPEGLHGNPAVLARALRARLPDQPVTTTSTVTHVVAGRSWDNLAFRSEQ
jgi:SAM-dependent methyltransferase